MSDTKPEVKPLLGLLGDPGAAACEGDACLIPGSESVPPVDNS